MEDLEIIDAHVHLQRTVEEESSYWMVPGRRNRDRWGTPERALDHMDRKGISHIAFMVLLPRQLRGSLPEKAKLSGLPESERIARSRAISEQVAPLMREMNEWGSKVGRRFPRLLPFVCISDDLGDSKAMVEEMLLRVSQGARGVKMHPGAFAFFPDDEKLWPVYEKCQELGLPVLADSGPSPQSLVLTTYPLRYQVPQEPVNYGEPKNFERVLKTFPRLKLILAHLGSAWWDERVELAQKYPNLCFDTAQGFAAADRIPVVPHRGLAEEDAVRIFRKIGIERILFGTDSPAIPFQPQLEQVLRLELREDEKRMILSENAKRIMRI